MSIEIKVSRSFEVAGQLVEVTTSSLGGVVLKLQEVSSKEGLTSISLSRTEALALAEMVMGSCSFS